MEWVVQIVSYRVKFHSDNPLPAQRTYHAVSCGLHTKYLSGRESQAMLRFVLEAQSPLCIPTCPHRSSVGQVQSQAQEDKSSRLCSGGDGSSTVLLSKLLYSPLETKGAGELAQWINFSCLPGKIEDPRPQKPYKSKE